jgi:hypothetical protein
MILSKESALHLEEFLRDHLTEPDLRLPEISLYNNRPIDRIGFALGFDGLTFRKWVFVTRRVLNRKDVNDINIDSAFLAHEAIHVLQYRHEGTFIFLAKYLCAFVSALRSAEGPLKAKVRNAYLAIPYEQEALQAEKYFRCRSETAFLGHKYKLNRRHKEVMT